MKYVLFATLAVLFVSATTASAWEWNWEWNKDWEFKWDDLKFWEWGSDDKAEEATVPEKAEEEKSTGEEEDHDFDFDHDFEIKFDDDDFKMEKTIEQADAKAYTDIKTESEGNVHHIFKTSKGKSEVKFDGKDGALFAHSSSLDDEDGAFEHSISTRAKYVNGKYVVDVKSEGDAGNFEKTYTNVDNSAEIEAN